MKVGDLVKRMYHDRTGIVTRDLRYDRYMVFFFDTSSQYDMDKRLLELISESR